MQTKLDVADNTGAKLVQCIHVLGGSGRAFAHLGDAKNLSARTKLPKREDGGGGHVRKQNLKRGKTKDGEEDV